MINTKLFFIDLNVESDDRYDLSKLLEYSDNYDPLNSTFLNEIKSIAEGGEYVIANEEGRPDLVSYNIYNTTQYWQIIMLYNGIDDVDFLTIGLKIKYPSIADLENLFFNLKARQSASTKT